MEREIQPNHNHKFEGIVVQDEYKVFVPNQVIRVERKRWKKKHIAGAFFVGALVGFILQKTGTLNRFRNQKS